LDVLVVILVSIILGADAADATDEMKIKKTTRNIGAKANE
jgi:hypothetical protein